MTGDAVMVKTKCLMRENVQFAEGKHTMIVPINVVPTPIQELMLLYQGVAIAESMRSLEGQLTSAVMGTLPKNYLTVLAIL